MASHNAIALHLQHSMWWSEGGGRGLGVGSWSMVVLGLELSCGGVPLEVGDLELWMSVAPISPYLPRGNLLCVDLLLGSQAILRATLPDSIL